MERQLRIHIKLILKDLEQIQIIEILPVIL